MSALVVNGHCGAEFISDLPPKADIRPKCENAYLTTRHAQKKT